MRRYNPKEIEPKWQKVWEETKANKANDKSAKPKHYALSMFPYPSGIGLHIGHTRNFTITDVIARHKRMTGHEVLHPMGWDSFGLPGENYAIKTGIAPQESTKTNTDNFRQQCKHLGLSVDWDREFGSTDPDYYKWTQWFFLLLHKRGLAYQQESSQFWCDECKTVLANEQVVNGCCWRHEDKAVSKKLLKQWFFKITDYADRLVADLEDLDWPEGIKLMQRNWIGKSKGAEIEFKVEGMGEKIRVFTTRIDTIYSAAFMVLAPELELVGKIATPEQRTKVNQYVEQAQKRSDVDRQSEDDKEKTGVFTGAYAINPANGEKIPIWIGDFVLAGYGTGAVFGDIHDERDFVFAKKYDIPTRVTVIPDDEVEAEEVKNKKYCFTGEGILIDSHEFTGLKSSEARDKITSWLAKKGQAEEKVNFKMRDWLISRQRYWGAPIPIIHCQKCGAQPVPEDQLPVILPELKDYQPTGNGRSPLAKVREWVEVDCPKCGGKGERETDTMDGFACSSWYFLRFTDPHNNKEPFSKELAEYWLPVDSYVGGAEHAVMHLLYARMWTKVMQDAGLISFGEPFKALYNQGMLLAADGQKISKSKGNDISPEDIIGQGYGADALRMITLFLAPYDQSTPWSNEGLAGIFRFLQRVWTICQEYLEEVNTKQSLNSEGSKEILTATHKAIKRVSEDLHELGFNTAISASMEFTNELYKIKARNGFKAKEWKLVLETLIQLLAPFAPHISEELWEQLGNKESVHTSQWPVHDEKYLATDNITIVVQINGKLRATIEVPVDSDEIEVIKISKQQENVAKYLDKEPKKTIFIVNKLINFVV